MTQLRQRTWLAAGLLLAVSSRAMAQTPTNSCASAPIVTVPGSYSGTTIGATNDGTAGCGQAATAPDVWVKFIAAVNSGIVADMCSGTGYDVVLSARTACAGTELACNDDSCGLQSSIVFAVIQGNTYWIRISGYNGATGAFSLTLGITEPPPPPTSGPDVIVGDLNSLDRYAPVGGITAYAVGTTSCNVGDQDILWIANNNQHPVIGQSFYRLKNGRFEHLGQSWLKHAFAAIDNGICGTCNGHLGAVLGVGCSDPYGAGLNGSQDILGPKWQVNATTGNYPYPYANPAWSGSIARRIQVQTAEIDPAQNAGALYFAEAMYVTTDDALFGDGLNNASYRRITFASAAATPAFAGATQRRRPAIMAWRDNDAAVTQVNADYIESALTARFIVSAKATPNGDGTWNYEYAAYNHNANRSGGSFSIPVPTGAAITNIGFHDVAYHSGDGIGSVNFNGTDWTATNAGGQLTWATQTFQQNQNANALRWGTLYNFRFTANIPPMTGSGSIGLFKPGIAGEPTAVSLIDIPVPGCRADWNHDIFVNSQDFFDFLADFFNGNADFNNDGLTNSQDFFDFLASFFNGC